ncbi:GntR family transcriptional regulator [Stella humosa]|uniref:GntR family transcriptional regulator n=1 Tax=Stella humosa TaxID=94 RepID=A0A3N1LDR4_9PROT|nr:GntR family transcriptional regulator [Stella humosa]ROP91231.1 GntR family transcriptional regulator [Stella humosa]BBK34415.1 transcriptional regulator [Stella humosa]
MTDMEDGGAGSAPHRLYAELRDRILDGTLAGGMPLRQEELAARHGVSRSPVREALRRLEADGLVTYQANRGAVVSQVSLADALEMLDIRIALECRALRLAVPAMTDPDFARIEAVLDAYGAATDVAELARLNRDFHLALYAPADRPRLLALIQDNIDNAHRFARVQVSNATGRDRPHREHRDIFRACRAGDIDAAVQLLDAHIAYSQKALVATVRRGGHGS